MVENWNNGLQKAEISISGPTFQYSIIPVFQLVFTLLSIFYIKVLNLNGVKAEYSHVSYSAPDAVCYPAFSMP
jgi:hypothetical protein